MLQFDMERKKNLKKTTIEGGGSLDERIWNIAAALEANGHLTADELAGKLDLSSKTVRSIVKNCQRDGTGRVSDYREAWDWF